MTEGYIETNNIRLHYLEYAKQDSPLLILLHGLTANAHAFEGLISHGLKDHFHIIAPDLRGRGLSEKPAFHYTLQDHTDDIIGLMNALKIEKVILGGHSYGGLLSAFLTAQYPERVEKIILLDAAARMNDKTLEMLGPTLSRLDKTYPDYASYLSEMKAAPQNTFWDQDMEKYYRADANVRADGTVNPYPNLANIIEVSSNVIIQDWEALFGSVRQPALLLNGCAIYTLGEPLLPEFLAKETVDMMKDCRYVSIDGNHHTMLYGAGAAQIVRAVINFAGSKQ